MSLMALRKEMCGWSTLRPHKDGLAGIRHTQHNIIVIGIFKISGRIKVTWRKLGLLSLNSMGL